MELDGAVPTMTGHGPRATVRDMAALPGVTYVMAKTASPTSARSITEAVVMDVSHLTSSHRLSTLRWPQAP